MERSYARCGLPCAGQSHLQQYCLKVLPILCLSLGAYTPLLHWIPLTGVNIGRLPTFIHSGSLHRAGHTKRSSAPKVDMHFTVHTRLLNQAIYSKWSDYMAFFRGVDTDILIHTVRTKPGDSSRCIHKL